MLLMLSIGCVTPTTSTEITTAEVLVTNLNGTMLDESPLIRWIGRTEYVSAEERMYFYHTATGFSVRFTGTELAIRIYCTNSSSSSRRPYFTVSTDDEIAPEGSVIYLTAPDTVLKVVENLPYGEHTVTFLKRSEAIDSETSISAITTDGYFSEPDPASELKVLLLGGSGLSGYGNLGSPGISRTTANSDSLQTFGFLTARSIGADVQFVAASGWGLKWGFNPTNRQGTVNIRTAFDKTGIDDDEELIETVYDPLEFIPDYVIVNLGGNDFDSYVNTLSGTEAGIAKSVFRQAVVELVSYLHELYPNAYILWTHTGSQNGAEADTAIGDLDPKHNYTRVVVINKVGSNGDPIGSNNHASVTTHEKNAAILIAVIQSLPTR